MVAVRTVVRHLLVGAAGGQPRAGGEIAGLPQRRRTAGQVLSEFPKPVVAAVNGYAVGIGCIVTYCCDLIVASERAEWRLPQVALGILPNHGGIARLARWVCMAESAQVRYALDLPHRRLESGLGPEHRHACLRELALMPGGGA